MVKRLEEMTLQELWELFPITLVPHDDRWAQWAAGEMARLKASVFGRVGAEVHHVGSTAVKGIWAKPIIDLLVEADPADFGELKHCLLQAGWRCMNEAERRLSFNKGYTPAGYAEQVFHLHLRARGDNDEVYFRDYLNAHADVAKQYESLKLSLWKRYEHDRDGYTEAKTEFVRHYTVVAKTAAMAGFSETQCAACRHGNK